MSAECLSHLSCCKSYDELTDIASTIQAYTSIHFNHEEWIKIRFFLMLYSCIIFMWTIIDSIFTDRALFYFIYATHWILLLNIMLYLICSYVITLVIHERITSTCGSQSKKSIQISKRQKKNHYKNNHFEDISVEQNNDNIPSLSQLGLFKWNKFIVFLQNASLSPSIVFPIIFWFVIFPNISDDHSWYDVLLEFNIHGIIPILILFDFIFSSRTSLYIDIYQPLLIGIIYCLWTYIIWTNDTNASEIKSYLYEKYFDFELNDFILWFLLNLSGLCFIHLTFAFIKSKVLSKHFMPIQLSTNHIVIIDKNGNIIDSKSKQYDKLRVLTGKKKKSKSKPKNKNKKSKKDKPKNKPKKNAKSPKGKKGISELNEEPINLSSPNNDNKSPQSINTDTDTINNNEIDDDFASFDNIEFQFDENKNDQIEIAIDCNKNDSKSIMSNAGNSIKEGFKNLIAIIDSKDIKYNKPIKMVVSDINDESSTSSDDNSDITDDENNHSNSEYKQFYSLKGNQTDVTTDDEKHAKYNTFNAVKTKSIATLLNLSKKLHTVHKVGFERNNKYNSSKNYKSEIEYSEQETSGMSDDEMKFGLKSGLSRYDQQ